MVIKTERLTVRPVRASDWEAVRDMWADFNKSQYSQYDMPHTEDGEEVREIIEKWSKHACQRSHMFFSVCLDGVFTGYVTLHIRPCGHEIGYCFCSENFGHGYARESIAAIMEYCREKGIFRFIIRTALKNTPSVKLALSLGFSEKGTERLSFYRDENGEKIFFEGGIFEFSFEKDI